MMNFEICMATWKGYRLDLQHLLRGYVLEGIEGCEGSLLGRLPYLVATWAATLEGVEGGYLKGTGCREFLKTIAFGPHL